MYNKDKIKLPQYFKYPVTMLTRSRYRCAGWFVIAIHEQHWYLTTGGKPVVHVVETEKKFDRIGYASLSGAIWSIVEEYRQLNHEIYIMEKEDE